MKWLCMLQKTLTKAQWLNNSHFDILAFLFGFLLMIKNHFVLAFEKCMLCPITRASHPAYLNPPPPHSLSAV